MGTWKQFLWMWVIIIGCMALIGASVFMLPSAGDTRSVGTAVMIILAVTLGGFIFGGLGIFWLWSPPAYRHAKRHGVAATAKVLTAQKTGWRNKRVVVTEQRSVLQQMGDELTGSRRGWVRLIKWEYRMTVQVERPDAMPYETTMYAYLEHPPTQQTKLNVLVHPSKPQVLVLNEADSGDTVGMFQQRKP